MRRTDPGGHPAESGNGLFAEWTRSARPGVPVSSRRAIITQIREAIISGQIPAGQQLKQDELSALFGVSPAPVRETLRQLESEGLVEHFPNRGVFVVGVSDEEALRVLLPIRLLLETFAAHQVVSRLDDELIEELQRQIEVMDAGADTGDIAMLNEADARFHELLVEASGSPHTIQLWRSVLPRIRLQFYRLVPRHPDLHDVTREHQTLLEVLRGGDPVAIDDELRVHIVETSAALILQHQNDSTNEGS
ncbi:GntR family transcriptional regulator [Nakamurella lactea]|uniref:GntR family transcriptional regulator n=1 Tax=Nakamurella lactea TaxID=459515 RepID=UPI00041A4EB2|nr:GntR family transcriptional regulator [Nakamurella lactea]